MLKNLVRLESVVENRIGHFYLDNDTPLPIVKEMLFQFQKYIGQLEDSVKKQQEQNAPSPAPEESKIVPLPEEVKE
jgi:hypothetical protein